MFFIFSWFFSSQTIFLIIVLSCISTQLPDSLAWKLVGVAIGKNIINLPTNWRELLVITLYNKSVYNTHIIRESLDFSLGAFEIYGTGGYIGNNANIFSNYDLTVNSINARNITDSGSVVSDDTTTKVYYR